MPSLRGGELTLSQLPPRLGAHSPPAPSQDIQVWRIFQPQGVEVVKGEGGAGLKEMSAFFPLLGLGVLTKDWRSWSKQDGYPWIGK